MSQPIEVNALSYGHLLAYTDLSAKQYYLVKATSNGIELCGTAGEQVSGVLLNKPIASEPAKVAYAGVVPCVAGGTVAVGDRIKTDTAGKGVAAQAAYVNTSDGGAAQDPVVGSNVIGIALSAAASGEQFNLQIAPMGAIPTTAA